MNAALGLTQTQKTVKRIFDIVLSLLILCATFWIICILFIVSTIDTKKNGFFIQERVGQYEKVFKIIKIRTMKFAPNNTVNATARNDSRITPIGKLLRISKLDELPEVINVLLGQMSFVGPRPEVPGYANKLHGNNRVILLLKPGITGPATLKYKDEETLLAKQNNPQEYNDRFIYPDKVKINLEYSQTYSFTKDMHYIFKTIFG